MHEPVGQVQFVVFEKFTSAYLFQIAQEKSCDYLLIIYMKKFRDGTWWLSRRNVRVERNQGKIAPWITPSRACTWFENKRFDWAICEFLWSLTNQNAWFVSSFSTELTLFCTVLKKKTAVLLTNQNEEIFSCILL